MDKEQVDVLLRHGQVITMDPPRRILVDGGIAVGNGRILAVGPDRDIGAAYESADERDLKGALVHPGLIDAHVHANSPGSDPGLRAEDHCRLGSGRARPLGLTL